MIFEKNNNWNLYNITWVEKLYELKNKTSRKINISRNYIIKKL